MEAEKPEKQDTEEKDDVAKRAGALGSAAEGKPPVGQILFSWKCTV